MGLGKDIKEFFNPSLDDLPADNSLAGRFVLRDYQLGGMVIYIVTDRETGVSYLTKPGNDCPFTPLIDPDGTPHIS